MVAALFVKIGNEWQFSGITKRNSEVTKFKRDIDVRNRKTKGDAVCRVIYLEV